MSKSYDLNHYNIVFYLPKMYMEIPKMHRSFVFFQLVDTRDWHDTHKCLHLARELTLKDICENTTTLYIKKDGEFYKWLCSQKIFPQKSITRGIVLGDVPWLNMEERTSEIWNLQDYMDVINRGTLAMPYELFIKFYANLEFAVEDKNLIEKFFEEEDIRKYQSEEVAEEWDKIKSIEGGNVGTRVFSYKEEGNTVEAHICHIDGIR